MNLNSRASTRWLRPWLAGLLFVASTIASACGREQPKIDVPDTLRRGDVALEQRNFREAAELYRLAVQQDQSNAAFRMKLAAALRSDLQWKAFAQQASAAADLAPSDRAAQLLGIEALNALARFEDSNERLTPLLRAAPDDSRLLVLSGLARAQLIGDTDAMFQISEAWRTGRDAEAARLHLRRQPLRADDAAAEATLRRAYAIDPASYTTRMAMVSYLWATNRLDEGAAILKIAADQDPRHALLSRTLGLYYEQAGRFVDAEQYLRISASGNDRDSVVTLAEFDVRRGRLEDGLATIDTVAASDDADSEAIVLAGEIELRLERAALARARADRVLAREATHAAATLLRARALLASGETAKALSAARSAVAAAPGSRDAHIVLARALEATGDLNRAFDEYSEGWRGDMRDASVAKALAGVALKLGRHGVAVDLANQSLRLNPGDQAAAVIFARGQLRLGKLGEADRAIAPFAGQKSASAELLALEGEVLAARGRTDDARNAFRSALKLDRDSLEALEGLVNLDVQTGQAARVQTEVHEAAARHQDDPGYLLLDARIGIALSDFAPAEAKLRSILTRDEARTEATLLLAALLSKTKRPGDAQQALQKALDRQPSSVTLRFALADLLDRQGRAADAETQYEQVLADNMVSAGSTEMLQAFYTAQAKLAALYANQNTNLDEALQLASSAKRYRPNDPFFSDALGWVHVRKQHAGAGLPHLELAVRAEPGNPTFRYHLGVAFEQLGEFPKARAALSEAIRIDPDFAGAEAARTLLKGIGK